MTTNIKPVYLGDSVYASYNPDTEEITLTTGSHIIEQADSVIFLETEVIQALKFFLERLPKS